MVSLSIAWEEVSAGERRGVRRGYEDRLEQLFAAESQERMIPRDRASGRVADLPDVWYVDHWSLVLDLRILGRTVAQVVRQTDAAAAQGLEDIDLPERLESGLQAGAASNPVPPHTTDVQR
jgi:hypothetical protein